MATFIVNGKLVMQGIKESTTDAKQLNKELTKTETTAKKLSSTKIASAAFRQSATSSELTDYGVARSIRPGGTGASARDFAQEAQGLGGLVRLYATYAANVFAASAAFTALSNAMDTTNMIKGLDQLGTASGVALGSLSKRLVEATGGAISLREAMEATVKASSSGMDSSQIERMGVVARQASQALGVDMSDAISRISRGITKLEPELLDELGIFTRIDPAVQAYAKSVDKSVSSLTDFERRMAFANAVLEEGEKKFSEIDIDTNPYSQLLASIKDLAQEGLEVVNRVVAPLVGFLSQSPTALSAVIAGIAAILVKQALPAIGQFKAGLAAAAEEALALSLSKAEDAQRAKDKIGQLELAQIEERAEKEVKILDDAQNKITSIKESAAIKGLAAEKLLSKDISDITEKDLKRLESSAKGYETRAQKLEQSGKGTQEQVSRYRELAKINTEVVKSLRGLDKAQSDYLIKEKEIRNSVKASSESQSFYAYTLKAAETAKTNATKQSIVTNAAYNASLIGPVGAIKLMNAEIATSEIALTKTGRAVLFARAGFAALGGTITTLASRISAAFGIIGVFVSALTVLDSILSKTSKESSEFDDSLQRTEKAASTLTSTMKRMYEGNIFNLESIQAQTNASIEFSSSLEQLIDSTNKLNLALSKSPWDKFKNDIASVFGGGIEKNFAENLSNQLTLALEALDKGPIQTKLVQNLAGLVGLSTKAGIDEIVQAISKLDPKSETLKKVQQAFKQAGIEAGNAASRASQFNESFKTVEESFKALGKTFEVNDPLVKFAKDSIISLNDLDKMLEGSIEASIDSIANTLGKLSAAPIFGKDKSIELAAYSDNLSRINKEFLYQSTNINSLNKKLKELRETRNQITMEEVVEETDSIAGAVVVGTRRVRTEDTEFYKQQEQNLLRAIETAQKLRSVSKSEAEALALKVRNSINQGLVNSIELVATGLRAALSKGSTEVLQRLYSAIDTVPELAAKQYDLKIQELSSEAALIKVMQQQLAATHLNTIALKISAAENKVATARRLEQEGMGDQVSRRMLSEGLSELESLREAGDLVSLSLTNPLKALDKLNAGILKNNQVYKENAAIVTTAATEAVGLQSKLNAIANQQQMIRIVEKPLAVAQQEFKSRQDALKISQQDLQLAQQSLDNRVQAKQIMAEEAALERGRLAETAATNALASDLLAIDNDIVKNQIISNGLRQLGKKDDADTLDNKTKEIAAQNILIAMSKYTQTLESNRLKTLEEITKQKIQQRDFEQETQKIIMDTEFARQDSVVATLDAQYQILEASGMFSEQQLTEHRLQLLRIQEEAGLKKKLYELEISYKKQIQDLEDNRSSLTAEQFDSRTKALTEQFKQASDAAKLESATRITVEEIKIEAGKYKEFKDELRTGLTDVIVTSLTEGAEAGGKKMKDILTSILKNTLTRILNNALTGFTNGIVNAITGAGGGGGGLSLQSLTSGANTLSNLSTAGSFASTAMGTTYSTGAMTQQSIALALQDVGASNAVIGSVTGASGGGTSLMGALGSIPAWGWVAIAAIALWEPLFGRKLKEAGTKVKFNMGEVEAEGYRFYEGGLFRSDKTKQVELDPVTKARTETAASNLKQSAVGMAETLGISSDAIKNYTGELKINMKGVKDEAEAAQRIQEAYRKTKAEMLATAEIATYGSQKQLELEKVENEIREQAMKKTAESIKQSALESGMSTEKAQQKVESSSEVIAKSGEQALENLENTFGTVETLTNEQLENIEKIRAAEKAKSDEFEAITNRYIEDLKKVDEMVASAGISAESLGSIIRDAMLGRISGEEAGQALADQVLDGIYNTIAGKFANEIGALIVEQLVDPLFLQIVKTGTITTALSQGQIDTVINFAINSINAFKAVLNDPGFQAAMQQFQSEIKNVGNIAGGSASSIRSRTSSMNYLNSRTNAALEEQKRIAEEKLGLEKEILGLLGDTAKLRELELKQIAKANRGLQTRIWALEDARQEVERSLAALERSIEAEKDAVQKQLDNAIKLRDGIKDVFELLEDSIKDLLGTAQPGMQVRQARELLQTSIATGVLPDREELSSAIDILKNNIQEATYATKADKLFAEKSLAIQLMALKGIAEPQLTEAEQTVVKLEAQLTKLDQILEQAKAQNDVLNKVDNSILGVNAAIGAINTAITNYTNKLTSAKGVVSSKVKIPKTETIPTYASGGYYPGGVALVGEDGPELINFKDPGMVYTAKETKEIINNSSESSETDKELLQEIRMLRYEMQSTAQHTNKTYRLLDRVTRNGKSLLVTDLAP